MVLVVHKSDDPSNIVEKATWLKNSLANLQEDNRDFWQVDWSLLLLIHIVWTSLTYAIAQKSHSSKEIDWHNYKQLEHEAKQTGKN